MATTPRRHEDRPAGRCEGGGHAEGQPGRPRGTPSARSLEVEDPARRSWPPRAAERPPRRCPRVPEATAPVTHGHQAVHERTSTAVRRARGPAVPRRTRPRCPASTGANSISRSTTSQALPSSTAPGRASRATYGAAARSEPSPTGCRPSTNSRHQSPRPVRSREQRPALQEPAPPQPARRDQAGQRQQPGQGEQRVSRQQSPAARRRSAG